VDAVNLMTVHAAKGLEFPVVFVVNLARGSGGARAPIRVSAGAAPEDAVAVGDFQSEFDDDQTGREFEETKRLLYVAVTRARDRLYLASVTENGEFKPRKGSLGRVLPASMHGLFSAASSTSAGGTEIAWTARNAEAHAFRVCVPSPAPQPGEPAPFAGDGVAEGGAQSMPANDDFDAIGGSGEAERSPITGSVAARPRRGRGRGAESDASAGAVLGRIVHRMFQAEVRGDRPPGELAEAARGFVLPEEEWTVRETPGLSAQAARIFAGMWSQPGLQSALDGAECRYEVPFSLTVAGSKRRARRRVLRGVIDCLAIRPDGRVVVVDFKTGTPREADRRQLGAYLDAARSMFPGSAVEGRLVYPVPID
jgi:ATP-dependent helicase/nuclease subunit A